MVTPIGTDASALMASISQELDWLRESIALRDVSQIEMHTRCARELLTKLRPLLSCGPVIPNTEFLRLQHSVRDCAALLIRVKRTVRALLNVHCSFSEQPDTPLGVQR